MLIVRVYVKGKLVVRRGRKAMDPHCEGSQVTKQTELGELP